VHFPAHQAYKKRQQIPGFLRDSWVGSRPIRSGSFRGARLPLLMGAVLATRAVPPASLRIDAAAPVPGVRGPQGRRPAHHSQAGAVGISAGRDPARPVFRSSVPSKPVCRTGARCSPPVALRPANARAKQGAGVGRWAGSPLTFGGDQRSTPIPRMPAAPSILPRSMAPIARRSCPSRAQPPNTSGRSEAASRVSRILHDDRGLRWYKMSVLFHRTR
jgi:hypothetical protein